MLCMLDEDTIMCSQAQKKKGAIFLRFSMDSRFAGDSTETEREPPVPSRAGDWPCPNSLRLAVLEIRQYIVAKIMSSLLYTLRN